MEGNRSSDRFAGDGPAVDSMGGFPASFFGVADAEYPDRRRDDQFHGYVPSSTAGGSTSTRQRRYHYGYSGHDDQQHACEGDVGGIEEQLNRVNLVFSAAKAALHAFWRASMAKAVIEADGYAGSEAAYCQVKAALRSQATASVAWVLAAAEMVAQQQSEVDNIEADDIASSAGNFQLPQYPRTTSATGFRHSRGCYGNGSSRSTDQSYYAAGHGAYGARPVRRPSGGGYDMTSTLGSFSSYKDVHGNRPRSAQRWEWRPIHTLGASNCSTAGGAGSNPASSCKFGAPSESASAIMQPSHSLLTPAVGGRARALRSRGPPTPGHPLGVPAITLSSLMPPIINCRISDTPYNEGTSSVLLRTSNPASCSLSQLDSAASLPGAIAADPEQPFCKIFDLAAASRQPNRSLYLSNPIIRTPTAWTSCNTGPSHSRLNISSEGVSDFAIDIIDDETLVEPFNRRTHVVKISDGCTTVDAEKDKSTQDLELDEENHDETNEKIYRRGLSLPTRLESELDGKSAGKQGVLPPHPPSQAPCDTVGKPSGLPGAAMATSTSSVVNNVDQRDSETEQPSDSQQPSDQLNSGSKNQKKQSRRKHRRVSSPN
ncbi:hypothetical protein KP509_10G072100 [Ceratopteris richardii]|uniref:Uncharacterized protein n=1 Tax=Ceratopteris richardii TaxID=49495 RepID=A0A8T2TWE7_CERRI|nr:hypothetical protein KP509_10G072100 [Ceratopteris richardii]